MLSRGVMHPMNNCWSATEPIVSLISNGFTQFTIRSFPPFCLLFCLYYSFPFATSLPLLLISSSFALFWPFCHFLVIKPFNTDGTSWNKNGEKNEHPRWIQSNSSEISVLTCCFFSNWISRLLFPAIDFCSCSNFFAEIFRILLQVLNKQKRTDWI